MNNCEESTTGCQINELFQLLSKAHTLDLVHVFIFSETPLRFVDLQKRLNISPNTLSTRLKALDEAGFVTRTAYNEIPPRVDYEATDKARALCSVFRSLHDWAEAHTLTREDAAAAAQAVSA